MNNIKLQGINIDGIKKEYSLNDFKGQKVILYFYPKDNTSGCTQEACDFRDNINRLTRKRGILWRKAIVRCVSIMFMMKIMSAAHVW